MRPTRAKLLRTLDWRLALGALLLWALLAVAVAFVAGRSERQQALVELHSELQSMSRLRLESLARQIDRRRQQVRLLARTPPALGMVRASLNPGLDPAGENTVEVWQSRLETIFKAFAGTTPDVLQVRLIGVADNGLELIRVVQRKGRVEVLAPSQLRHRGTAPYFREAVMLGDNEVQVSAIELSREEDDSQSPAVPTMRVATPVFAADGQLFAIVLVDLDAGGLLSTLQTAPDEKQLRVYVTDQDGYFLLHPNPHKTFAAEPGRSWRWQDEFRALESPAGASKMELLQNASTQAFAVTRQLRLNPGSGDGRRLTIAMAVTEAPVNAAVASARRIALLAMLGGGLLAALLGFVFQRQRRALSRHQAELAAMVGSSQDAIIGTDLEGLVSSWNRAAQQMFGYHAEEAIGRPLAELVVPEAQIEEDRSIRRLAASGAPVPSFESVRRRRDGTEVAVSLAVTPIATESDGVTGLADTVRDISAQRRAERENRELNASLERQGAERNSQHASLHQAIVASASYAVIATEPDGLITLCNPAAERLFGYAAEELLGLQTLLLWHDPEEIAARAEALSQELQQPLAPGFEVLVAKSRRDLPNQHEWTVLRKDGSRLAVLLAINALRDEAGAIQGFVGMASESARRECEAALRGGKEQANQSCASEAALFAGISHEPRPPVNAMLGTPGPWRPSGLDASRAESAARVPGARARGLSGLHLLLVEDNPTNQLVARELLVSAGAEVLVANDGHEAIAAVQRADQLFNAVLMDIQMPGLDGYGATRELRRHFDHEQLPIIAMTANAMPADRVAALEAGMNEHVGKPFELATLVGVIRQLTGRAEEAGVPAVVPRQGDTRPVLDEANALRRFDGNQAIYQQALAKFSTEAPAQLADLPTTLDQDRRATLQRLHSLKGLAATIGAEAFAAQASEACELLARGCSPARWVTLRQAMQVAGGEAADAARARLAPRVDQAAVSAPAAPVGDAVGKKDLLALWQMLEANNMHALCLFDRLHKHYQGASMHAFNQLGEAIERLDFAAAALQCQALLGSKEGS